MACVRLVTSFACARFHRFGGGRARHASHGVIRGVAVEPSVYLLYKAKKNQKDVDVRPLTNPVSCVRVFTLS
jgi:hypothetical protein